MNRSRYAAASLLAALFFAACIGDEPAGSDPPPIDAGVDVTETVSNEGGSTPDDGGAEGGAGPKVVELSAGDGFACALREDGSVVCWGRNGFGETGQPIEGGETCDGIACRLPTKVAGVVDAIKIASGPHQTCAVTKSGSVLCWGASDDGVLGRPPEGDPPCGVKRCSRTPTAVPSVTNAIGVAVSRTNACAWTANGALRCWGHNRVGGLARGERQDALFPPAPTTIPEANGPQQIAMDIFGTGHACAILKNGNVTCWGRNSAGELGVAPDLTSVCQHTVGTERCTGVPQLVQQASKPVGPATSIAATDGATCASVGDDVYCWGTALHGVVAAPPSTASMLPAVRATGISALSGNFTHVCGLTATNDVKCWGSDTFGELGFDPAAASDGCNAEPCKATPVIVPGVKAKKVAAGAGVTVAVTTDDRVLAWGANGRAQLGHLPRTGENQCAQACNPTPEEVVMPSAP